MEVSTILKRASEKSGCSRFRYKERDVPTSVESVTVLPFFGDRRSSFALSSLLLRRIKEELKGSRYFVLASWPGDEGLFQYVDEYWQVEDPSSLEILKDHAAGFSNSSSLATVMRRSLNQYFYDVMGEDDIRPYYNDGLTSDFFDRFRHVKVSLPSVPSISAMGADFSKAISRRESKVFVSPSKFAKTWRAGQVSSVKIPKDFWVELVKVLVDEGFSPVVSNDLFSYDLSSDVEVGCIHFSERDVLKRLSVMRACGCVLDVFGDLSRMAIAARSPFLCFDERQRFSHTKEYEINDLCASDLPRDYIFSFAALVEKGGSSVWKSNIFDHMVVKLRSIHANADRDSWPPAIESNEIVPYEAVRRRKAKRLGSRFIKIERD